MSYGLQTYNASGMLEVSITDRFTRSVSTHSVSIYYGSVSVYVPGITTDGTWCVIPTSQLDNTSMSISTNYVTWRTILAYNRSFNFVVLRI